MNAIGLRKQRKIRRGGCDYSFRCHDHSSIESGRLHTTSNSSTQKWTNVYNSTVMEKFLRIFLVLFHLNQCRSYPTSSFEDCPKDCICYSDYLYNLESWKWVESDIHRNKDDPEHEEFNPYTEHNEVFENPKLHRKRQRESKLATVNCMIRDNSTENLVETLKFIPKTTQALSLIQAPGSGTVTLNKQHFKQFHTLLGLEIRGYSENSDSVYISGDAFSELASLTYLSLETVFLQQTSVENELHTLSPRILRINYTFSDMVTNEITSQVLIINPEPDENGGNSKDTIVPYSEFKKAQKKEKTAPLDPKFRVAFTGLPKLQHLRISGCNLHDISWDMFYKLENLKYLILDENDLLFLPDFVFYATSNLSTLSLSRNRILNLQTVGLAGLLYLQKLDVTYNNITHLSELSLPPFPHLEVADFRYNPIDSIFPNTFEIMNSTKLLYLGNPTTPLDLSPNSFYGLVSLTKLDIMNVKIRLLEKTMLKGMPALKTLIMTGDIPRISYDAFGEVTQVEKLILRNCGIRKISMDAFFGLSALTELDLSHNELAFLPPGIFEEQTLLREVYLQHNQLTTLPLNLIDGLPIKILRLEANPWHCSCDMRTWDPQQINRVKRYHIPPPNNTLCQKIYDKGSMCFETYEPKFEATYSYEKRVSPVCATPLKFSKRSVFQVLRKELKYCTIKELDTEGTPGSKPEASATEVPAFPANFSIDTLRALEKQLLEKPVKIRKPRPPEVPPSNENNEFNFVKPNNQIGQPDSLWKKGSKVEEATLVQVVSTPSSAHTRNVTLEEKEADQDNLLINHVPLPNQVPPVVVVINSKSKNESKLPLLPVTENISTTPGPTFIDKTAWLQSRTNTLRTKEKKKKNRIQPSTVGEESRPNNNAPPPGISKKAWKLARAQKSV